jgi:hypothetical protein
MQQRRRREGSECLGADSPLSIFLQGPIVMRNQDMGDNALLETWDIHDRINLYLLDAVEPEALGSLLASKGGPLLNSFHMFITFG